MMKKGLSFVTKHYWKGIIYCVICYSFTGMTLWIKLSKDSLDFDCQYVDSIFVEKNILWSKLVELLISWVFCLHITVSIFNRE